MSFISSSLTDLATNQKVLGQTIDEIRQLKAAGIPVVLPSYLPSGFRLSKWEVSLSQPYTYWGTYKGPNNCEISFQGANEHNWGAPTPIRQWVVNTKLFGKVILEEWSRSDEIPPKPNYFSFDPSHPALKDFPRAAFIFTFECERSVFSLQEALQILQSMQFVK